MDKILHDTSPRHSDLKRIGREQFPVDTKVIRMIRFDANGDLMRIVAMNDQSTPSCSAYREYHHGNNSMSIDNVTSFTLRSSTTSCTQQNIDAFVGSMPLHLDVAQAASWCRGIHEPSVTRKRLYKATDPDDSNRKIGVLLEQDSQGKLMGITWYKTQPSAALFQTTPETLVFEVVKNAENMPSLDPNDIGGWAWYFTTSLVTCS